MPNAVATASGSFGTTRDAEAHCNDPGFRFLERAEHGTHLGFQLPVEDNFGGFVFRGIQQLFGPGFSSAPAVEHLGVKE